MTKCPRCKKNLNIGKQVSEWDKEYGDEWISQAMINIICPNCDEGVIMVELYKYEETEEIQSPIGKVKIPKLNKNK